MPEIVLVQPKVGSWEMLGARLPASTLSIAALPHQKGYNVKIIDQRTDENWKQSLKNAIKNNPICVGITCMTGKQILYALEASRIVKNNSNAIVVWGGVHATLLPEQTLQNPYIDMVILGEGDQTFMELCEALEKNKPIKSIKGICYKEGGKVVKTPTRPFIKDLDKIPDLPYELVNVDDYSSLHIEGKSIDFVSSRGCPHKCSFCYNNYFNKQTWRALSAKETVKRIKNLVDKYNIKTIYFQDDNFCANLDRLGEIIKGIIKEKLDIKWGTLGLRIDTAKRMDDNFLGLMEKSGCINVDIGAESGDRRILNLIDKQITVEDMFAVNKRISKFPFIVKYTFMIGFPTETKAERHTTVKTALKLFRENKNVYTPFSVYTPYPGTPMYELAVKHGFVPPETLEEWGKFSFDDWYFNFKSWHTPKTIRELKSIAFTSLFANENVKYKINKTLTKVLFNLYHPIAKMRFEHNLHFLPIESLLSRKLFDNKL